MKNTQLQVKSLLNGNTYCWLITGVAGFIGSNILEYLLKLDQDVIGLDNFSTGHHINLDQVCTSVGSDKWKKFKMIEGDIRDLETCKRAVEGVDIVLHQAALGSVPRSINNPLLTNAVNIDGFLNMLLAAKDANITRFVYAASSSTYGDHPDLPKIESRIGNPLSPYAVTKYVNELYANVFSRQYGMQNIGLRYFNVFGPRQDPLGQYAAVIPKWIDTMLQGEDCFINGDGETSRDFCFIDNVVQANILAGLTQNSESSNQVYNIAFGKRTTLNELHKELRRLLSDNLPDLNLKEPVHTDFRPGDVMHSLADISKAERYLGYSPAYSAQQGLESSIEWYIGQYLKVKSGDVGVHKTIS